MEYSGYLYLSTCIKVGVMTCKWEMLNADSVISPIKIPMGTGEQVKVQLGNAKLNSEFN